MNERADAAVIGDRIIAGLDTLADNDDRRLIADGVAKDTNLLYEMVTLGSIDVVAAMRDTIECADEASMPKSGPLSYRHIATMLDQVELGGLSYGKQCRWLGWMQCAVVAGGCATLEDMKNINLAHKRQA